MVSRLVGRHGEMRFFCSASLRLSSWPTSAAQFLADWKGDSNSAHCEQNGHARAPPRTVASLESTSAKGDTRADGASQPLVDQARLSPVRRSPIRGLLAV